MEHEMQLLIDNKTSKLVEIHRDQALIDCKWVYKLKDSLIDDEAMIFKARLVDRGFTQNKDVDYTKFSHM